MPDSLYPNVVALLNFVDNEIQDRSPVAGTFTGVNGATLVAGSPPVLRLDGSDDYVLGPDGSNYAFPGQFCIEIICQKTAAGGGNYDTALTTDTSNGSAVNGWIVELGTVRGFTFVANGGAIALSVAATINDGSVHHWCVRRGADNIVRLSKDGTQIAASSAYSASIASSGFLGVGRNGSLTSYPFAGDVLAVRITKGSDRYTGTSFTPDTAPFDTFAYSISGNVKDATGANAARKVVALREASDTVVGTAMSDATTGNYTIPAGVADEHTLVFYPASGENLPALVLRGVVPV